MSGRGCFDIIPTIDLSPLRNGDANARAALAASVADACTRIGFFSITGHGVPEASVQRCFDAARRFFDRPADEKMRVHLRHSPHHRGYGGLLEEQVDPASGRDWHEAFDLSLDIPADDPEVLAGHFLCGPNQWPEDMPWFREALEAHFADMLRVGQLLFEAFALALDLPADHFTPMLRRPGAFMRVLRYPPQGLPRLPDDGPESLGIGAHSDYECFTVLAQDVVGGLEVRNADGQWIAVPPQPGAFVVNIGDMMARWTNDRFASTLHRVVNRSGRARMSIPFFHGVDYDTRIETLPGCLRPGEAPRYAPVSAHDYVAGRLAQTYGP